MLSAKELAEQIAAEQRLQAAFAAACKAESARMVDLSERLCHTPPEAPLFREVLRELVLCEAAVKYLPDCSNRSGYRLEKLRTAAASVH